MRRFILRQKLRDGLPECWGADVALKALQALSNGEKGT
jgi:hypothetical protein